MPAGPDHDWQVRAACRDYPEPQHFFDMSADFLVIHRDLLALCSSCPVLDECRSLVDDAEGDNVVTRCHGFWAGETPKQRVARRRRARRPQQHKEAV